jgi:membrane fusion protein (multidrug efflux system)
MQTYDASLATASSSDPQTLLANAAAVTTDVNTFINKLAVAANNIQSGATQAQMTALATARASVSGLLTALSAAEQSYRTGSVTTTASTDANVETALGGLQAAQANLEKTIIRSPISGVIVSLPVTQGDFITTGNEVAEVSNPSALEVDTYVTTDDAKTLAVNAPVMLDGDVAGVITSIAPTLDPTTNEIEVKIGITGDASTLTDGETVSVSLARTVTPSVSASSQLLVPIDAVKINPDGAVVLTVTASSTIAYVPVTLGTILGQQVVILGGLTASTTIVTDARGLSLGDAVVVDPN